ncbi:hypothetical protein AB0M83_26440 [Amycolatopsis sp. NPDC051106]|uniref:hypothetical protein n=1 Tax=unclassified Amycolatopsis TaxID=2618356 RepID=UPI00341FD4CA
MTSPSITDAALGTGARIGRYFSLVSMLPALFLTGWTVVLIGSGAWAGTPNLRRLGTNLSGISLGGYAWILLATAISALFLHPLQLGMTRVLEGYWGSSRLATILLRLRITHYRKKKSRLNRRQTQLDLRRQEVLTWVIVDKYLNDLATKPEKATNPFALNDADFRNAILKLLPSPKAHTASGFHAALAHVPHQMQRYPTARRMMPTRLGNALRSAEDRIGRQYGLDAIRTAPYITLVAPDKHVDHLHDARQQMDTSIRLCVVALVATLETVAAMLTDRWWLLTSLVPYGFTWIAYRAAVAGAGEYMETVRTIVDLNRFRLYEELHVKHPDSSDEERAANVGLMALLGGAKISFPYRKPDFGDPDTDGVPPTSPGNP